MTGGGALFSQDRVYRYALWRVWNDALPSFVVIGLNPSTADESVDDPTIRRCVGFAKREGCGRLVMLNLFAIRATNPRVMRRHAEPVGPKNDHAIRHFTNRADVLHVVAAWGAHGSHRGRDAEVRALVSDMRSFGITKSGQPKHPLYLPADAPLIRLAAPQRVDDRTPC